MIDPVRVSLGMIALQTNKLIILFQPSSKWYAEMNRSDLFYKKADSFDISHKTWEELEEMAKDFGKPKRQGKKRKREDEDESEAPVEDTEGKPKRKKMKLTKPSAFIEEEAIEDVPKPKKVKLAKAAPVTELSDEDDFQYVSLLKLF